jgi:hypothetical protein
MYFLPNLCHPWHVRLRDQRCPNLIENTKTTTKPVQPGGIPLVLTEIDGRAGKLPSQLFFMKHTPGVPLMNQGHLPNALNWCSTTDMRCLIAANASLRKRLLYNAVAALIEAPNTSLLGLPRLLKDEKYRERILADVTDPIVHGFFAESMPYGAMTTASSAASDCVP